MSLIIHNVIVHRIVEREQQLVVLPRAEACEISPEIEQMAQNLNHIYNSKPGKGVGGFLLEERPIEEDDSDDDDEAEEKPRIQNPYAFNELQLQLDKLMAGEEDFVAFTHHVSKLLTHHLQAFATPETGFLVFSHFQFLATDYLLIALLDTKEHVEVTGDLNFSVSSHLDMAKMQLAARIDITQYKTSLEHNRYVSFIKGRIGRKVSDFFMQFMGCEELVDIKQQNKQLLNNVEQYLDSEQFDPQEKQATRANLVEYYKDKLETGEDISVKDIAQALSSDDQKQDFYSFAQSMEQPLEETFQPDRAAIKTLSKFTGQGGGISLSFDRKLLGDRVYYNQENDTITIKGLPANLRDQLSRWQD